MTFTSCDMTGGQYAIIGKKRQGIDPSGATCGYFGYAVGVTINGGTNIQGQSLAGILNPDDAWSLDGVVFEPLAPPSGSAEGTRGAAGAITHESGILARGLSICGCWFGDASSTLTGTWITFGGTGLSVGGGTVLGCPAATTGIRIDENSCAGIVVQGTTLVGGGGSSAGLDFGATSGHAGVVFVGNSVSNVAAIIGGTVPSDIVYSVDDTLHVGNLKVPGALSAASLAVGVSTPPNLLSATQADMETTGATGWTVNNYCTIGTTTAQAAHGSYSLQLTTTTSGNEISVNTLGAAQRVPALPGTRYYGLASFRADSHNRSAQVDLFAYDSAGTQISRFATSAGAPGASATTRWTQVSANGVAPVNTASIGLVLRVGSATDGCELGEVHYIDQCSISTDPSLVWALPATVKSVVLDGATSSMAPQGTAADVDLTLNAKGAGAVKLGLAGTGGAQFGDGAGNVVARVDSSGVVRATGTSAAIVTKTAAYTVTSADSTVLVNATSAAVTISLPAVASVPTGRLYTVKKIDSSANAATIDPSGTEQVEGASTYSLTTQNQGVTVQSDGTAWRIVGKV